jgi:hypothetical protein
VLGIGRRDPALHEALLAWSQRDTKLYVYDTLSRGRITDAAAHRVNLGDTYRRCKIAITNYAKYDLPAVTRDEREIPGRFWEGLASGVTMVGRAPDESLQHELIGESAVIDLPGSPADAVELIDKLHADPDLAVRRHRVQLALRGHDWAHRWARLFAGTGLDVPNRLLARIDRLASTAAELDHTRPGPAAAPSPRPG